MRIVASTKKPVEHLELERATGKTYMTVDGKLVMMVRVSYEKPTTEYFYHMIDLSTGGVVKSERLGEVECTILDAPEDGTV